MKNSSFSLFSLVVAMIFSLSLFSCDKKVEDVPTEDLSVTEEEAVDIITGAIVYSSEGMTSEAMDAAALADDVENKDLTSIGCGETGDSTVVRSHSDVRITANYTSTLGWGLNCSTIGVPTTLDFDRTTSGSYETSRMSSTDDATGDWVLSEIIAGPSYVINGVYHRTGQQNSLVKDMRSFTSTIDMEIDDLNIDKGQRRIVSGIVSFTLSGVTGTGETYAFDGDIVFLGGGSANILINGTAYTIDLF